MTDRYVTLSGGSGFSPSTFHSCPHLSQTRVVMIDSGSSPGASTRGIPLPSLQSGHGGAISGGMARIRGGRDETTASAHSSLVAVGIGILDRILFLVLIVVRVV